MGGGGGGGGQVIIFQIYLQLKLSNATVCTNIIPEHTCLIFIV